LDFQSVSDEQLRQIIVEMERTADESYVSNWAALVFLEKIDCGIFAIRFSKVTGQNRVPSLSLGALTLVPESVESCIRDLRHTPCELP